MGKIKEFFTDKNFFKTVLKIALPMVIQNGVTNLVNVLDNVMVGRISSEATSGVAIVNQFMFVFYLVTFGAVSAAGIFTAQYHGKGDNENVRATFRIKLMICFAASVMGILLFAFFKGFFINMFLTDTGAGIDPELTFKLGADYLFVMLFGIVPYSMSQAYASTLRETKRAVLPLIAGLSAVIINLILNYVLIFGKFGAPALGVTGAALATVISRYAEFLILVICAHATSKKSPFIKGVYKSLRVPGTLIKNVIKMGFPLILNEGLWALAVTLRNQCYSTRGLQAVTAISISSTFSNLFSAVYLSLGAATMVILGNMLGAGMIEQAKAMNKKLLLFSVMCSAVLGIITASLSAVFPKFYNTTEEAAALTVFMLIVRAATMPFSSYTNIAYFTLRSGGKVFITVLFDSVFMWAVVMPLSFILSRFTNMDIHPMFILCEGTEFLKMILGYFLLRRGTWAVSLVDGKEKEKLS